jgi:hypothetical protein
LAGVDLERVLAQADFIIANMLGKAVLALVIVSAILDAILLSLAGFQGDTVEAVETAITIIYVLIASVLATGLAEELGTGQAVAHLTHPITNEEYILAWLVSGPGLLGANYVLAILTPTLVIAPREIANPSIYEPIVYGLGELLYLTLLALAASIHLRSRSKAILFMLAYELLAPLAVLMSLAIVSGVLDISIDEDAITVITGIWHPISALAAQSTTIKVLLTIYSYSLSIILSLLLYRWARRMEV